MPAPHDPGQLTDEVSIRIAAPADRCYAIVSDPTQMAVAEGA